MSFVVAIVSKAREELSGTSERPLEFTWFTSCETYRLLLSPPKIRRGPRAKTTGIVIPRVFAIMTDHEREGSGVENEPLRRQNLVLFAGGKMASKNRGKICIWSNDARDMLIDLWSAENIQFALANSKIAQETREVYKTLLESKHSTRGFDFA